VAGIKTNAICEGESLSIHEIVENDNSKFQKYLAGLDQTAATLVGYTLNFIAEHGTPGNIQRFRHEGDGIYAIKILQYQIRILCFFDGRKMLILTHGFNKKYQKGDRLKREIAKAKKTKDRYMKQKGVAE